MIYIYGPERAALSETELFEAIDRLEGLAQPSCDESSIALLADISARLLKSPLARSAQQITVAGYWLRKSALAGMVRDWQERQKAGAVYAPRGVAFHLPPTNVDTMFLYSWALSVLAGNTNIVRLPTNLTPTAQEIIAIICQALKANGQENRHLFLEFDRAGTLVADISARSNLRMIWGGDAKVNEVSRFPVKPLGVSLGFPNRFSFSAIKATACLDASDEARQTLAQKFYNDMFWFDQLGCGSPRIVYWIGSDDDGHRAARLFWQSLDTMIQEKAYSVETGVAVQKFLYAARRAASDEIAGFSRQSNELMVFTPKANADLHEDVQGGGMIAQLILDDLVKIGPRIRAKDQTMTHFGFDPAELDTFARNATTVGLCRIVPVGEALSFEPVWDGIDLLSAMSRIVTIRAS